MSIAHLPSTLCFEPRLKWTSTQEKTICHGDYPFAEYDKESAEQFVAREYLQFLWLPEVRTCLLLVVYASHLLFISR